MHDDRKSFTAASSGGAGDRLDQKSMLALKRVPLGNWFSNPLVELVFFIKLTLEVAVCLICGLYITSVPKQYDLLFKGEVFV